MNEIINHCEKAGNYETRLILYQGELLHPNATTIHIKSLIIFTTPKVLKLLQIKTTVIHNRNDIKIINILYERA